jgi:hypothetical protein
VPSQRFEGLAGAAEAVVKSDRSRWESRESREIFSSSGNLPKSAANWRKIAITFIDV